MSSVEEIEEAIARLSPAEFLQLRDQIQKRFHAQWDVEFEEDVKAGRFDEVAAEALAEHRAGLSSPFPPDAE